jgi:hypothetical protein
MRPLRIISGKDLDEIHDFLGELKDGEEYKKRLAALEDLKKEINALIEVYGKASDIDRLRSNALRDEEQATKALDSALATKNEAKAEASKMELDAKARASDILAAANAQFTEREHLLNDGEADLGAREKALAKSIDDVAGREAASSAVMEEAIAIRNTYTEAVASLKKAIADTQRAL